MLTTGIGVDRASTTCEHYVGPGRKPHPAIAYVLKPTILSPASKSSFTDAITNMQGRRTAAIIDSAKVLGIKQFKQKQVEAIESFRSGKDTFVSLPTGYGNYAALPPAF